jgi:RNA polymerase sigma-70 factor (ECF subfamily)
VAVAANIIMANEWTETQGGMDRPKAAAAGDTAEDLALARSGDAQAFGRLVVAQETRLFQQALALCGSPSIAEDLAAETVIEAWKSLPRFRGDCRLSTWLYGILVHRYQKQVRRQRARLPSLGALPALEARRSEGRLGTIAAPDSSVVEKVASRETELQLRRAVDRLAPAHQAVVLLRFFEGARLPEIAAALRIPLGTAKSRLHHALERLRQMPDVVNLLEARVDSRS